jgi:hypothetical protein
MITALPWLVIWIAALVILAQRHFSGIPFEHTLAWVLAILSPMIAWLQFRA